MYIWQILGHISIKTDVNLPLKITCFFKVHCWGINEKKESYTGPISSRETDDLSN